MIPPPEALVDLLTALVTAKGKHMDEEHRVSFSLTPQMAIYLEALRKSGLYGQTLGNVARRLVEDSLAVMLRPGMSSLLRDEQRELEK